MIDWWELPGPRSFVEKTATELADGRSVVLHLPGRMPSGFESSMSACIRDEFGERPSRLDAGDLSQSPGGLLLDHLDIQGVVPTPHAIACQRFQSDRVVWLRNLDAVSWRELWHDFVYGYMDTVRNAGLDNRVLLLAPISDWPDGHPAKPDVGVAVCPWKGLVGGDDIRFFAGSRLRGQRLGHLARALKQQVIVELAGPDERLAADLAELPLPELLAPMGWLREWAAAVGLQAGTGPGHWHDGTLIEFEGAQWSHTGLLALQGEDRLVERRLWNAQVAVLFPWLERRRQELLATLERSGALTLPYTRSAGVVIDDKYDLEFSDLRRLANRARLGRDLLRTLQVLTEIRNALAHLEAAPSSLLERAGLAL